MFRYYDAYIFDLDGTLLNTLPDLVALTNMVLAEWDMPAHTTEEINSYVGGGARVLLRRGSVQGASEETIDALLARWKELYPEYGHRFTQPYAGMPEVLGELKRNGAKLGVLSNKFDAATRSVIAQHFPGVFDDVRGESPETPRKPDPAGLLRMIEGLGVPRDKVAYVGDSGTDMEVAKRAGVRPIGVTWGYRSVADLRAAGGETLLDSPAELLAVTAE